MNLETFRANLSPMRVELCAALGIPKNTTPRILMAAIYDRIEKLLRTRMEKVPAWGYVTAGDQQEVWELLAQCMTRTERACVAQYLATRFWPDPSAHPEAYEAVLFADLNNRVEAAIIVMKI